MRKHLKQIPGLWFFKASERTLAGIPDFIICVNGIFVALELKRDDKSKATKLQEYTLEQINKVGGLGLVVRPDNFDKVMEVLKTIAKGGKYDRNDMGSST